MHQGLAAIEEEGLRQRFDRHRKAGEQLVTGLAKLGFEPLVKRPEDRLWHLATVLPPAGVDELKLRERLLEKYAIEVGAALGQLAGKILRIGTMGPLANKDSVSFLLEAIGASV
jgi:alanine-glyoxylate transaminase/serine-glyoxylate transaminase/serine-pyruvate transaminase